MLACVTLTDSVSNSQILKSRRLGYYHRSVRDSKIGEIICVEKISGKNQSKKFTLFFDVAKRPTFPQPPGCDNVSYPTRYIVSFSERG